MKKIMMLLLFLASVHAFAEESTVQFEQANQLYRNGKYQDAARIYEQVVKNGFEGPDLFFNLGNCYFKLGNTPFAIVAYERARRLAPHDEDILYNLRLANLRIVDKIEPIPSFFMLDWWHNFVNLFAAERWALLTVILLWGMAVAGGIGVMSRSFLVRRIAGMVSAALLLCGILALVCEVQRDRIEENTKAAVVVTATVPVKSAPDAGSTDLFVIHEGLKLEILDTVGEWKKIRLADGKVGWLMEGSVEGI